MTEDNPPKNQSEGAKGTASQIKKAALGALFSTILVIPRIRRLRRQVALWTALRLIALVLGGWLVWLHLYSRWGSVALGSAIVLAIFGVLVRARPVQKSLDDFAQEFGALVVLNGGRFWSDAGRGQGKAADIFVCSDQLVVKEQGAKRLTRIPLSSIRDVACRTLNSLKGNSPKEDLWELAIQTDASPPQVARFVFQGAFAEHLARVAESTVRSQWKKELPVITR